MNIECAWLWALAALPLPLIAAWLLPRAAEQQEPALKLPFDGALAAMETTARGATNRPRLLLASLAWVLLVIAAARPQYVGDPVQLPVSGRDLMLAIDISGSMETEDMSVNGRAVSRLIAVKAIAGDFIERREGDRLGLILFGDQAYLQTPLTFDRETVRTQLNEAAIGLAGKRTAIGDAIGLAVKRLRDQPQENRVLVLLTDGDAQLRACFQDTQPRDLQRQILFIRHFDQLIENRVVETRPPVFRRLARGQALRLFIPGFQ